MNFSRWYRHVRLSPTLLSLIVISCGLFGDNTTPAPASNLVATAGITNNMDLKPPTYHIVNLTWKDNSYNDNGFLVEYNTGSGWSAPIEVQGTSYTHEFNSHGTVLPSGIYAYRVISFYSPNYRVRNNAAPSNSAVVAVEGVCLFSDITVTSITTNSAVATGSAISDGGSSIFERGVMWSNSPEAQLVESIGKTIVGPETGTISATIAGLSAASTYFVRSYAVNAYGISYGTETSFTTNP